MNTENEGFDSTNLHWVVKIPSLEDVIMNTPEPGHNRPDNADQIWNFFLNPPSILCQDFKVITEKRKYVPHSELTMFAFAWTSRP